MEGEGKEDQREVLEMEGQEPNDFIMNDEEPAFIEADEAVEVVVDDDNVPMDDADDDDDEGGDGMDNERMDGNVGGDMGTDNTDGMVDLSKFKIDCHTGPVYALAAYLDNSMNLTAVSGGGDDKAFLHRCQRGESPSTMELSHQHTDSVSCVALNLEYASEDLSKTPHFCAVGGYDGAIVVYDPTSGEKIKELEGPSDVEWLAFHPKGGMVLLAGSMEDCTVWMYHVVTSKCLQVFVGHESGVSAGDFTPDGRWALSASADGSLRVWAPRTGKSKHIFRFGDSGAGLTSLGTGGGTDGQLVVAGAEDGKAHVCHIPSKKVIYSLQHYDVPLQAINEGAELPMSVEAVGFASTNPNWCATGGMDGTVKVWDLGNSGQCRLSMRPSIASAGVENSEAASGQSHPEERGAEPPAAAGITRLQWHPQQPLIFASYADGAVRVWDARNGQLVKDLTGNTDVINGMAVTVSANTTDTSGSGSGNSESSTRTVTAVLTGGDDQSVRIFEL